MADVAHSDVITHTCAEHAAANRQQTMRPCSIAMQIPTAMHPMVGPSGLAFLLIWLYEQTVGCAPMLSAFGRQGLRLNA